MSETTSSPYVHLHPISPSSSFSSTDSAPHSEPTSDEQPDLGAFTTVLREWTHLQPPPRIPVQIRSATSSTTTTFQPEQSIIGSDFPSRSGRSRNSRISARSGISAMSSFTRPPSSSFHPDGSTVWNHEPIASYLYSGTPANDTISEDEGEDEEGESISGSGSGSRRVGGNTPSSLASTALTVEIASETDFPSFDGSQESNRIHLDFSPSPYQIDPGNHLAISLDDDVHRLDSRETAHREDVTMDSRTLSEEQGDRSSITSRDFLRPPNVGGPYSTSFHSQSHSGDHSQTSVQLQSQARAPTTIAASSSDSLLLPVLASATLGAIPTSVSASQPFSSYSNDDNDDGPSVISSTPTSTLVSALLNRSRIPLPQRTTSDSSYTTTGSESSSHLSLVSYQIPETPPITEDSDNDQEATLALSSLRPQMALSQAPVNQFGSSSTSLPSTTGASDSLSLKTQQSLHSSNSGYLSASTSSFATQRQQPNQRIFLASGISQVSSLSSNGSPLPNPYSPLPSQGRRPTPEVETVPLPTLSNGRVLMQGFGIVNDLGTPDHPPSETILYEPAPERRPEILPVDDDDVDEARIKKSSQASDYSSGYDLLGSASGRGNPPLSQRQTVSEQTVHQELQYEDDDDYPYQYPYSHTPRSHAQALTPKGIPTQPKPPTQSTSSNNVSFSRQLDAPNQLLTQSRFQSHIAPDTFVHHEPQGQQLSRTLVHSQSQPLPHHLRTQTNLVPQTQIQTVPQHQPPTLPAQTHTYSYPYTSTQSSMSQSYPSFPTEGSTQMQIPSQTTDKHGYPHSLLGLHALPASHVSPGPEDLPGFDLETSSLTSTARNSQPHVESDSSSTANSTVILQPEEGPEQSLPSLGYLDEALSFIASERARYHVARSEAAHVIVIDSREVEGEGEAGSGDEFEGLEGEAEWKQANDNEQDQPKRKRRRKRPPRSHTLPLGATASSSGDFPGTSSKVEGLTDVSPNLPLTPGASPKKKKRSKSASASTSSHSQLLESPSKKSKAKVQEKEFLIPPHSTPARERVDNEKEKPIVTILRRPIPLLNSAQLLSEEDGESGGEAKTPTNGEDVSGGTTSMRGLDGLPVSPVVKKGKRVGRKKREEAKAKLDSKKENSEKGEDVIEVVIVGEDAGIGLESDDDDNGDDGVEPQEDEEEEDDSLSNMSLLQPPRKRDRSRRRKGRDAHIHDLFGPEARGAYKSTPATPSRFKFDVGEGAEREEDVGQEVEVEAENIAEGDASALKPNEGPIGEKKKRARTKRRTLSHARSDPELRLNTEPGDNVAVGDDAAPTKLEKRKGKNRAKEFETMDILDMDRNQLARHISISSGSGSGFLLVDRPAETHSQPSVEGKRGRLVTLARKLNQLFPEQHEELGRLITRIEKQGAAPATKSKKTLNPETRAEYDLATPSLINMKRKKIKKGHVRTGSEGTGGEVFEFDDERGSREDPVQFSGVEEEEEEEIDPRGRPPKKGDVLIHVFIDHSNILIGLLSHLKRHPPQSKYTAHTGRGRPLAAVLTKATSAINTNDNSDPASAFAAVKSSSTRPLPIPAAGETFPGVSLKRQQPMPMPKAGNHPIPLPSFATLSRSLPTKSTLGTYMSGKRKGRSSEKEAISDEFEPTMQSEDLGALSPTTSAFVGSLKSIKEKKPPKHLWHGALTLILERGRPVTRRVVVTSSPLYQPMDSIERLGYELRVFIRVPDLGDGMDRERHRDKDRNGSGKSSGAGKSPVVSSSMNPSAKNARNIGHVRQKSGNTSAESGSGGGSGNASGGGGNVQHPYNGITNNGTPQAKIKYREQGVDELLQLKLHQALAATDIVPEGSTIVLATGDGNMGQFNEDGFLGPVRTALKRGWKVELYAWEDGLSRAWRREFGAGSEWGRNNMFQVIGMEQFASELVEASGWS